MTPRARVATRSPTRSPPGALPRARTSFVGRAEDLAAIQRRVEEGAQLITLLGPPGIGKTRLALRAAEEAGDATFCDLSEARDDAAMLTRVALALGVSVEAPGSDEELAALVGRALDQRGETLLVLDNAEPIVAAVAAAVARWMDAAHGALFLVTSRERLRVAGEHVLALGPLAVPARGETSPERILASEAVTLLVDRARAAYVGFARARADTEALAEIAPSRRGGAAGPRALRGAARHAGAGPASRAARTPARRAHGGAAHRAPAPGDAPRRHRRVVGAAPSCGAPRARAVLGVPWGLRSGGRRGRPRPRPGRRSARLSRGARRAHGAPRQVVAHCRRRFGRVREPESVFTGVWGSLYDRRLRPEALGRNRPHRPPGGTRPALPALRERARLRRREAGSDG